MMEEGNGTPLKEEEVEEKTVYEMIDDFCSKAEEKQKFYATEIANATFTINNEISSIERDYHKNSRELKSKLEKISRMRKIQPPSSISIPYVEEGNRIEYLEKLFSELRTRYEFYMDKVEHIIGGHQEEVFEKVDEKGRFNTYFRPDYSKFDVLTYVAEIRGDNSNEAKLRAAVLDATLRGKKIDERYKDNPLTSIQRGGTNLTHNFLVEDTIINLDEIEESIKPEVVNIEEAIKTLEIGLKGRYTKAYNNLRKALNNGKAGRVFDIYSELKRLTPRRAPKEDPKYTALRETVNRFENNFLNKYLDHKYAELMGSRSYLVKAVYTNFILNYDGTEQTTRNTIATLLDRLTGSTDEKDTIFTLNIRRNYDSDTGIFYGTHNDSEIKGSSDLDETRTKQIINENQKAIDIIDYIHRSGVSFTEVL
ncbi:hypothetical protein KY342_04130 [Candidatus Woesearchaeota archaeon]|nr:hypothetical protein [Candidatus Woesearchaeota archaeon]